MVLGALLDLGLPLEGLRAALGSLAIEYGDVSAERVLRAGVTATKLRLSAHGHDGHRQASADTHGHHHHHAHHSLKEIAGYVERSNLSREGKDRAIHLFGRLGEAEAAIHSMPLDQVHLHEVGALDSIIDIVGVVHGMEWLNADRLVASPLNVGSGTVKCAHGTFPVPAPATASLLAGVPVYAGSVAAELVTPTGALIVTEYADSYVPLPPMRVRSIGYGAGDRDFKGHPNVLRILLGDEDARPTVERIVVVECEIDDMNPQLFGPLMDRLHEAGALDVFYAPVQMKKNRPGTLVTVLAPPELREAVAALLFAETTTIGVRYQEVLRERLEREVRSIMTPVGPIRFKIARRDGSIINASPEFDDCANAARAHGLSIKDVQAMATKAWLDSL
jgi:pyridinium-3,5-bisthiocarboxylic acid mononucleotide nickel chelatase